MIIILCRIAKKIRSSRNFRLGMTSSTDDPTSSSTNYRYENKKVMFKQCSYKAFSTLHDFKRINVTNNHESESTISSAISKPDVHIAEAMHHILNNVRCITVIVNYFQKS